jgi:hypothetical protein
MMRGCGRAVLVDLHMTNPKHTDVRIKTPLSQYWERGQG